MTTIKRIPVLTAVTATTTSDKIFVGGARRVGLLLRRADHSSGNHVFSIKGSLDYGDVTPVMTTLNVWIDNVTNTNSQTLTRVASKTLSANGDAFLWLDPNCFVNYIEVTATETTDGVATVVALCEYEE
jgi:hypothetical protein